MLSVFSSSSGCWAKLRLKAMVWGLKDVSHGFVRESYADLVTESWFPFVFWWEERESFLMRSQRESEEQRERWKEKESHFFYSTGYYSKGEYCLELLQFLLQCSLLQRCYCSHSKRNRVWWNFWSAFFVCLLSKVRASWRCFKNHTDGALM